MGKASRTWAKVAMPPEKARTAATTMLGEGSSSPGGQRGDVDNYKIRSSVTPYDVHDHSPFRAIDEGLIRKACMPKAQGTRLSFRPGSLHLPSPPNLSINPCRPGRDRSSIF